MLAAVALLLQETHACVHFVPVGCIALARHACNCQQGMGFVRCDSMRGTGLDAGHMCLL